MTAQGVDTGSEREHLQAAARQGHAGAQATLAAHPLPPGFAPLWRAFQRMQAWRGTGALGPAPLTLHDVEAYERRYQHRLQPGALAVLKRLDFAALAGVAA